MVMKSDAPDKPCTIHMHTEKMQELLCQSRYEQQKIFKH